MNQKILSVLIIVFSSFQLFSQNHLVEYFDCITCNAGNHDNINMVFEYSDDPIEFLTEHVMSDYGPRDSGVDHYDWHGGIDYSSEAGNADFGDGIVSILGGTVQSIGRNRYKYVFVDGDDENDGIAYDFGYGHLFQSNITNQKSGNFFWQEVIGMPGNYAIIIDENTALFTQAGRHVIYPPNGNIRLKFNRSTNDLTINVFDIIGRVVYSLKSSETLNHIDLDLSTQSAGVYFIHLSDSRGNLTVKRIFIE